MTDRVRTSINKVSVALGLIITIVTLIAGGVRIVDLTSQTASTVAILSERIEDEQTERILQDNILKDAIVTEREERKADSAKQLVKLAEIDTKLFYLQQGQDQILSYINSGRNAR
jgi:hypothetical protein